MNKFKKWLIKKLGGYVEEPNREWYADNSLYKTDFVAPIITQIINADPVIKCKDCKHSIPDMSGEEMIDGYDDNFSTTERPIYVKPAVTEEKRKMIEMPITLEPYEAYCNRLIEETHKMVKEMHDIVHCKDCKYWKEDVPHNAYCEFMKLHGFEPDDFCSRGVKR